MYIKESNQTWSGNLVRGLAKEFEGAQPGKTEGNGNPLQYSFFFFFRQRKIYYRKRESDWLQRETSDLPLQKTLLYPIDGKLCPKGRGSQFIFSLQLGSCDHVVIGVSQAGGHIVLRNWHQQGKTGHCLKEKQDATRAMWPV